MARYRKLYTKTVESLDVHDMPDDFIRLFWVLLPLMLCREGRGLDRPAWIRSKVFPLRDDVSIEMIEKGMAFFESREMVIRYQDRHGRRYFQLSNWARYQGDTSREAESPYPPPQQKRESSSSVARETLLPEA